MRRFAVSTTINTLTGKRKIGAPQHRREAECDAMCGNTPRGPSRIT
jgi:hypothetical protein